MGAEVAVACNSWSRALCTWQAFTQRDACPQSFRISAHRSGRLAAHLSSNGIAEAMGEALMKSQRWNVDLKDFEVDVVVNLNDEMLVVLLPLLERSSARQHNFSCPGLTQPVAWAMARTLDIKAGEVIVDPMCGAGIILLEAAQCWCDSTYMGFDESECQVKRSESNMQLLASQIIRNISFAQADATKLPLLSQSVDAVVCDLPFWQALWQRGRERNTLSFSP